MPPPPASLLATLPDRVLLLTVSVPLCLKMPPPAEPAVLPDRVLPLTVSVPLFADAATVVVAELPDRVLPLTVSVPVVVRCRRHHWRRMLPDRVLRR